MHQELRKPDDLSKLFADKSVDLSKPIAVTCGSGLSSCAVALSAFVLGNENVAVYDGSWSEWGQGTLTPVVKDS